MAVKEGAVGAAQIDNLQYTVACEDLGMKTGGFEIVNPQVIRFPASQPGNAGLQGGRTPFGVDQDPVVRLRNSYIASLRRLWSDCHYDRGFAPFTGSQIFKSNTLYNDLIRIVCQQDTLLAETRPQMGHDGEKLRPTTNQHNLADLLRSKRNAIQGVIDQFLELLVQVAGDLPEAAFIQAYGPAVNSAVSKDQCHSTLGRLADLSGKGQLPA